MRHIVIHYHLYKNAGSTIYAILERNFSGCVGSFEGTNSWDTLTPADVLKYALEHPDLKAITSHHARLPVPRHPHIVFHPIVFLRHPIDRIGSAYAYERRFAFDETNPGENPGFKVAHENDLAGYVRWGLSTRMAAIRNLQTIQLSSRHEDMRNITATKSDLRLVIKRISQLPFLGITEQFDESLARLKNYLSPFFPDFDVEYVISNKSNERKATLQERLDDIKKKLGEQLYQELVEQNALDIELYNRALRLFLPKEQLSKRLVKFLRMKRLN